MSAYPSSTGSTIRTPSSSSDFLLDASIRQHRQHDNIDNIDKHRQTSTNIDKHRQTTITTTTDNMTIRHISINDMTLEDMLINDLLNSNIILRNKIADDLANMDMAIEDTVINNVADSNIDVKSIVIDKLTSMNMIFTELAKTIRPLKAWSGMAPSPATSSVATSPSQTWSSISSLETPPSENDEEDRDWPFVGRKGPLPPSPPLRQRVPTPDEVTEEFLSHTLYPLFGLSRHPNPRGLWTLEQNQKSPIPISLGKPKHTRFHYPQQNSETDYRQYAI
jgi:hypothetical protein